MRFRLDISYLILALASISLFVGCRGLDDPDTESNSLVEYTRGMENLSWGATFTSLNVWGVPIASKHRGERWKLIGEKVRNMNPDITLLQEAWTSGTRKDINKRLKAKNYAHFKRGGIFGSGVLYFTDWKIQKKSFRPFKLFGDFKKPAYYTTKGVGMVTANIDGLPVSLFNTHLMAKFKKRTGPRDKFTPEWKMELFEVMAHVIEQTDSDAFIIAGDFNLNIRDEEYWFWKKLSSLNGTYWEEEDGTCTSCSDNSYREGKESNGQLDYVFVSPRLELKNAHLDYDETYYFKGDHRHLSDHYGISGLFEIKSGAPYVSQSEARQNFYEAIEELREELVYYKRALDGGIEIYKEGPDFPLKDRLEYSIDAVEEYRQALSSAKPKTKRIKELRRRLNEYFAIFRP